MLPIAAGIATRLTRDQAESALPHAPVRPDPPSRPSRLSASRRMLVSALRRLASGGRPTTPTPDRRSRDQGRVVA